MECRVIGIWYKHTLMHFNQQYLNMITCKLATINMFISSPHVARLTFNVGGPEGLDTGNTIPYFLSVVPYPPAATVLLM